MMSQGKSMDDYSALNPLGRVPFHMQLTTMLKDDIARSYSGGAEEAGMKGWRERAADIFIKHGGIAAKMKSASRPLGFSKE